MTFNYIFCRTLRRLGSMLRKRDTSHECTICQEVYADVTANNDKVIIAIIILCGHYFHLSCITTWIPGRNTCPICRGVARFDKLRKLPYKQLNNAVCISRSRASSCRSSCRSRKSNMSFKCKHEYRIEGRSEECHIYLEQDEEEVRGSSTDLLQPTSSDGETTDHPQPTGYDGQTTEDPQSTSYDGQTIEDPQSTSSDGQTTEDLQPTSSESQNTDDSQTTSYDGQTADYPQPTSSDGQTIDHMQPACSDGHTTCSDDQTTDHPQPTSSNGETTYHLQPTSSNVETTDHLQHTSSNGQTTDDTQPTSSDGQTTDHLLPSSSDGQTADHLQPTSSNGQITDHLQLTSSNGQTTVHLLPSSSDGQAAMDDLVVTIQNVLDENVSINQNKTVIAVDECDSQTNSKCTQNVEESDFPVTSNDGDIRENQPQEGYMEADNETVSQSNECQKCICTKPLSCDCDTCCISTYHCDNCCELHSGSYETDVSYQNECVNLSFQRECSLCDEEFRGIPEEIVVAYFPACDHCYHLVCLFSKSEDTCPECLRLGYSTDPIDNVILMRLADV